MKVYQEVNTNGFTLVVSVVNGKALISLPGVPEPVIIESDDSTIVISTAPVGPGAPQPMRLDVDRLPKGWA